jgi:hypothetical protein
MRLHKNLLLSGIITLLLTACGGNVESTENAEAETEINYNLRDYNDGVKFIVDNFELEYALETAIPSYIEDYDVKSVSENIVLALNASGQICYLGFDRISKDEAELIITNTGLDVNDSDDLMLLLNDPDAFHETHGVSHLTYDVDDFYFHVVGIESETLEAMNRKEPYSVSVFYNDKIFEDFINE